uniref:Uncharacterized protein n=1 Tax=Strongyloides venezuelensis TaxID=75913 RepID=A0A0K0F1T5_STRVS
MKIHILQLLLYIVSLLCTIIINGLPHINGQKNDKIRCINACTIKNNDMIKGENKICLNPIYRQKSCFADITLGCYNGIASLISNDVVVEERYIQGCFTRRNRRSSNGGNKQSKNDNGKLRIIHKEIKNFNFKSDVSSCFTELCNL